MIHGRGPVFPVKPASSGDAVGAIGNFHMRAELLSLLRDDFDSTMLESPRARETRGA
jgi:hypothetical protein